MTEMVISVILRKKLPVNKILRIYLSVVFFVACLYAAPVWADPISLDGKIYSGSNIVNAFISATMGTNLSEQSTYDQQYIYTSDNVKLSANQRGQLKDYYPWLSSALSISGRSPDLTAMSRWNKSIKVSFELPDAGPVYSSEYDVRSVREGAREKVFREVQELIPIVANKTGLDIGIASSPGEGINGKANMFIVLVDSHSADYWITKYKRGGVSRIIGKPTFRAIESQFTSAIFYTPYVAPYQVDGYYTINSDNEIQTSVCYIRDDHEDGVLKNLVRQCLMRSLGFPSMQLQIGNSILSWYGPPTISEQEFRQVRAALDAALGVGRAKDVLLPSLGRSIVEEYDGSVVKNGYSQMDQFFMKLLYSSAVKPGMKFPEIIKSMCLLGEFKDECQDWQY